MSLANDHSFAARTARCILPNGITLLVLENHANPTVSVSGYIKAGSYFNPPDKHGLARITADMLNKGTAQRSKLEIAEALEFVGAGISFSGNTFTVSVSAQSLSRDFPAVLSTLAEELREPSFPPDELEKLKQRVIAAIQHNQEDTRSRAMERFTQLVYPAANPFHQLPAGRLIQEIESLSPDDVKQFYRQHYSAASLILAIVGDINAGEVQSLVAAALGDWQGAPAQPIELAETPLSPHPQRDLVQMKDKANADVVIGHPSRLRRANPDYLAAVVANRALGQSTLSSRLGLKIRDELGLTYGINSFYAESGLGDGPYLISVTVAPSNVERAIEATLHIVEEFVAHGIREEELRDEQSSIAGSFKVGLATNAGMALQLANSELYSLGIGYLDEFPQLIKALTKPQIDAAIRKYLHPECATTVVAGTYDQS
jgi:zinc protease